jgi:hypothetical protein
MLDISTIETIENGAPPYEFYSAMQRAINSGQAWSLQGSFGRAMMDVISEGFCMLGSRSSRDYWGNYIPSRDEVIEGEPGSKGFVVETMGEDWANMLEMEQ